MQGEVSCVNKQQIMKREIEKRKQKRNSTLPLLRFFLIYAWRFPEPTHILLWRAEKHHWDGR